VEVIALARQAKARPRHAALNQRELCSNDFKINKRIIRLPESASFEIQHQNTARVLKFLAPNDSTISTPKSKHAEILNMPTVSNFNSRC